MTPETERPDRKIVSIKEARNILGKNNFFGPEEWSRNFTNFEQFNIPEIPWTKDELKHPGLNQQHFLFLGLERLNQQPDAQLNLKNLNRVFNPSQYGTDPMFDQRYKFDPNHKSNYQNHPYFKYIYKRQERPYGPFLEDVNFSNDLGTKHIQTRWYLMPIGVARGTEGLLYKKQLGILPKNYEASSVAERVFGNVLYFLQNHKYLEDISRWALTKDFTKGYDYHPTYHSDYMDDTLESNETKHKKDVTFALRTQIGFPDGRLKDLQFLLLQEVPCEIASDCSDTGLAASLKLP